MPKRHRFSGEAVHDLGEVWSASSNGSGNRMACLEVVDDGKAEAGPSLVYMAGWEQDMAAKVAGSR